MKHATCRILLHRHHATRGQSIVEFALSLSLLMILITGIINTSSLLWTHLQITQATRQGALIGATAGVQANADCAILAAIAVALPSSADVTIDRITIYQAARDGSPLGTGTLLRTVYTGNPGCTDMTDPPTPTVNSWPPGSRAGKSLGVGIDYTYHWQLFFWGGAATALHDATVMPVLNG